MEKADSSLSSSFNSMRVLASQGDLNPIFFAVLMVGVARIVSNVGPSKWVVSNDTQRPVDGLLRDALPSRECVFPGFLYGVNVGCSVSRWTLFSPLIEC